MSTLRNGPQKLLIIGPDPFISQSSPYHSPQPRIDFSYYEISGPDICSLICVVAPHDVSFQKKIGSFKNDDLFSVNIILILKLVKAIKFKKSNFLRSWSKALKINDLWRSDILRRQQKFEKISHFVLTLLSNLKNVGDFLKSCGLLTISEH